MNCAPGDVCHVIYNGQVIVDCIIVQTAPAGNLPAPPQWPMTCRDPRRGVTYTAPALPVGAPMPSFQAAAAAGALQSGVAYWAQAGQ